MSEKIVQLNEEIIKGQIKELVRGSVEIRAESGTVNRSLILPYQYGSGDAGIYPSGRL